MTALVVYESIYGNTRAVAEAIAQGLGAEAVPVQRAPQDAADAELLVVGGPTHLHGLATAWSRRAAVAAAEEDGVAIEPDARDSVGLRTWLRQLRPRRPRAAAAFDTRLDRSAVMTGLAARGIRRRLLHRGYSMLGAHSFLVGDSEGPLEEGELERARAWGAELAACASGGRGAASQASG